MKIEDLKIGDEVKINITGTVLRIKENNRICILWKFKDSTNLLGFPKTVKHIDCIKIEEIEKLLLDS